MGKTFVEFTPGQILFDSLTRKSAQRTALLLRIAPQPAVEGIGHVFDLEGAHRMLITC